MMSENSPRARTVKEMRAAASAPSPTSRAATMPAAVFNTNDKTPYATIHAALTASPGSA
jgi:hypothetical protein